MRTPCIIVRNGHYCDMRAELVAMRRRITNDLNFRLELQRSISRGENENAFADIQHFYNAMTFAISALEDAYKSTSTK